MPARYVLVLDGGETGEVAKRCNQKLPTPNGAPNGDSSGDSSGSYDNSWTTGERMFLAGVALHPESDNNCDPAEQCSTDMGWNDVLAGTDVSGICRVISGHRSPPSSSADPIRGAPEDSTTFSDKDVNPGLAATSTASTGNNVDKRKDSRIWARSIFKHLRGLLENIQEAGHFEIDILWIFGPDDVESIGLPTSKPFSPLALAVFGTLSKLIDASSQALNKHAPLNGRTSWLTFFNCNRPTDDSKRQDRQSRFASAWGGVLNLKQRTMSFSECSASQVYENIFDPKQLWRGTITCFPPLPNTNFEESRFKLDDFLEILESRVQPKTHATKASQLHVAKKSTPTIAIKGVYIRSKKETRRWPTKLKENIINKNCNLEICMTISLRDADNIVLSSLLFQRHGEVILGVRSTAMGPSSLRAMRRWSGRMESVLVFRICDCAKSYTEKYCSGTHFLMCFPKIIDSLKGLQQKDRVAVEFSALVVSRIPQQLVGRQLRNMASCFLPSVQATNDTDANSALCVTEALKDLPLMSKDCIFFKEGFSFFKQEELAILSTLGLPSVVKAESKSDVPKKSNKFVSQRRSLRRSVRDSNGSHGKKPSSSLSTKSSTTDSHMVPLSDLLSRIAKQKGSMWESKSFGTPLSQQAWTEVELYRARLHKIKSLMRDSQVQADIDWLVRVAKWDDGIPSHPVVVHDKTGKHKRSPNSSKKQGNNLPEKTGKAEAAMAIAREKIRDFQRSFMKTKTKHAGNGSTLSAKRARSVTGTYVLTDASAPKAKSTGSSIKRQRQEGWPSKVGSSSRKSNGLDNKFLRSSSCRVASKEAQAILKVFDPMTGKMRTSESIHLGAPLPHLSSIEIKDKSNPFLSTALSSAQHEFGSHFNNVKHGFDWWHPETSRAEEKIQRGLRVSKKKGGTLSVALKMSGSVVFSGHAANAISSHFAINQKQKPKKNNNVTAKPRGAGAKSMSPKNALNVAGSSSDESQLRESFALHERFLISLVPPQCDTQKFSRLMDFATHMTHVVLNEYDTKVSANGILTDSIVRNIVYRNCEHATMMFFQL